MASLEDLNYYANITDGAISRGIERGYRDVRNQAFGEVWRGLLTAATSGFGLGVLAVAGIFVAGMALSTGALATIGEVRTAMVADPVSGVILQPGVQMGFVDGIMHGGGAALRGLFTSGFGWAAMGVGGLIGGVIGWRKEQAEIDEAMEKAQLRNLQRMIEQEKARAPAPMIAEPQCEKPVKPFIETCAKKPVTENHAATEIIRRQIAQNCGIEGVKCYG